MSSSWKNTIEKRSIVIGLLNAKEDLCEEELDEFHRSPSYIDRWGFPRDAFAVRLTHRINNFGTSVKRVLAEQKKRIPAPFSVGPIRRYEQQEVDCTLISPQNTLAISAFF